MPRRAKSKYLTAAIVDKLIQLSLPSGRHFIAAYGQSWVLDELQKVDPTGAGISYGRVNRYILPSGTQLTRATHNDADILMYHTPQVAPDTDLTRCQISLERFKRRPQVEPGRPMTFSDLDRAFTTYATRVAHNSIEEARLTYPSAAGHWSVGGGSETMGEPFMPESPAGAVLQPPQEPVLRTDPEQRPLSDLQRFFRTGRVRSGRARNGVPPRNPDWRPRR